MSDASSQYYDDYWKSGGFNPRGIRDYILESFLEAHTSEGDTVVEIGCGDGSKSGVWLQQHSRQYVGLDVSPSAVEAALGNGLSAWRVPDSSDTGLPSASAHCVVCTEVLEHLFQPQETAREAWRILRPGGTFIATVPNTGFWRRRLDMLFGRWNPLGDNDSVLRPWRDPHIRFYTASSLRRMIIEAGFEHSQVSGYGGGLVSHMPFLSTRMEGASSLYRRLELRMPSLLAYRLLAIGTR